MTKKKWLFLILLPEITIAELKYPLSQLTPFEVQKKCVSFLPQEAIDTPDCISNYDSEREILIEDIKNSNDICCFVKIPHRISSNANIPNLLKDKQLSFYWSQELIGSDLLKPDLRKMANDRSINISFITIIDEKNNPKDPNHPEHVRSLITDNGNHSMIPKLHNERIKSFTNLEDSRTITDIITTIENEEPSLMNISLSWGDHLTETVNVMKIIAENAHQAQSIMVISAGNIDNQYSTDRIVSQSKQYLSKNFNAILVGNLSIAGRTISKRHTEVAILAPSDNFLTSANEDGSYHNFGGTSGAAALVTGSLAAFEWLSGYHPTGEEAKILLEKTAIPTQSSKCGGNHGKGIVNTYQLGQVGIRLKKECSDEEKQCFKRCETNNDVRKIQSCKKETCNKLECFKSKIQSSSTYQFNFNSEEYEDIKTKFPECESTLQNKIIPCHEKQEAFVQLRKAVLLHPERKELWDTLSCVYEKNGFTQNTQMLQNIKTQMNQECKE